MRSTACLAIVFGTLLSPLALAGAKFAGGELLVGGGASLQLSRVSAGAEISALGPDNSLLDPRGMAFGPDGKLYVAAYGADVVLRFDADGTVDQVYANTDLDGPSAVAFSPRGELHVASRDSNRVLVFDDQATLLATIGVTTTLDTPSGLAFAPNGHLFVASEQNNAIYEFDENRKFVRSATIGCGSFLGIFGLAFGWDGFLYTCCRDDHAVKVIGGDLTIVGTLAQSSLVAPSALAFGPDDRLYVADAAGDVAVIDRAGNEVATISGLTANAPQGLAFAPWRFGARIETTFVLDGVGASKLNESYSKSQAAGPVISLLPGSRVIMLTLADDVADDSDLASLLGTTALVLQSGDAVDPDDKKHRSAIGTAVLGADPNDPLATIMITMNGKGAFFAPKNAAGTFTLVGRGFTVAGTVETKGKE